MGEGVGAVFDVRVARAALQVRHRARSAAQHPTLHQHQLRHLQRVCQVSACTFCVGNFFRSFVILLIEMLIAVNVNVEFVISILTNFLKLSLIEVCFTNDF